MLKFKNGWNAWRREVSWIMLDLDFPESPEWPCSDFQSQDDLWNQIKWLSCAAASPVACLGTKEVACLSSAHFGFSLVLKPQNASLSIILSLFSPTWNDMNIIYRPTFIIFSPHGTWTSLLSNILPAFFYWGAKLIFHRLSFLDRLSVEYRSTKARVFVAIPKKDHV